ncbi:SMC family ATPase [Nocardioides sp. TRM66260-LWL]|uniref:AAA family ATPase n=1 Tax=Nocardioides sp. TRM66260-LWL TaxID=2874478 RepID=UPI001CC6D966|nr:SMC family ATPase [Nocardioides sp. TRM66260-LWL]MBZ5734032.1 SMC family ATPase [Nocardioides sp. TRM66260-LWL]
MRLHHLEVTAFGPFVDPVSVDFDALSAAGLFLLTGPTGAGKTSVLDAVCFALFGDVPGDRATAKRLRSDQAEAHVPAQVRLEATLGGRRLRLTRSPAWERPKRRGTGMTTEPAKVAVTELRGGSWEPVTTRADEAGQLVGELLGMTLTQFTQVAMLPQGRFQAFLRARADERHQLLQRLFRTGRFEQVERWLRDERIRLRRRTDTMLEEIGSHASRVLEAAGAELPEGVEATDRAALAVPAADGTLIAWARSIREEATQGLADAADAVAGLAVDDERAGRELDEAVRLRDVVAAVRTLRADEADLEREAPAHRQRLDAIAAAGRAASVRPLQDVLARTTQRAEAAHADLARARSALRPDDEPEGATDAPLALAAARDDAAEVVVELRALLPRRDVLVRQQRELVAVADRLREAESAVADLEARGATLPEEVIAAEREVTRSGEARRLVEQLTATRGEVCARLDGAREAVRLAPLLAEAREHHVCAREAVVAAHERLLDAREERIANMAAELAGGLAVGGCCPVCGSAEHPSKAIAPHGQADAAEERRAQRVLDDAKAAEHTRAEAVRDLELASVRAVERAAGAEPDELERLADDVDRRLAEARPLADGAREAEQRLARLRAEADAHAALLAAARTDAAVLAERAAMLVADLADGRGHVGDAVARLTTSDGVTAAPLGLDPGPVDPLDLLAPLLEQATRRLGRLDAVVQAQAAAVVADDALDEARRHLETALAASGFDDAAAVDRAWRSEEQVAELASACDAWRRRADAADALRRELLEQAPDLLEAETLPDPDVETLRGAAQAAAEALSRGRERLAIATTRSGRLVTLLDELEALVARWLPAQREHERVAGLAAFVEGKSEDNRLRMRLSAYVLAYRLAQVVEAANVRLTRMTDHRYRLEHTAERGHRDTRGGLGLLVRDDWSGEARDPATLSGGETFVVSLALALGLADVITGEIGGAALDTLFVDEGFGSLDADTLDDVLDMLDALRDGGRVVGVVSHVAEMRDRIPTQLVLRKARSGSRLEVRVAAAG